MRPKIKMLMRTMRISISRSDQLILNGKLLYIVVHSFSPDQIIQESREKVLSHTGALKRSFDLSGDDNLTTKAK